ncbi:MAG: MucR family transcriptional regulator [Desulfovibrio sp.]|nr:MucR family transcriptional regulator [Desulfovibrio sp.]
MDDFMKQAIEIAKAQASVRPMTPEQFMAFAKEIADGLRDTTSGAVRIKTAGEENLSAIEAKKSIKEKSVTCLVCGKSFKVLGKRHLATHGLSPKEYREKFGLRKRTPLICKSLARERREMMKGMKLWERKADKNSVMPMDALADMSDE